MGFVIITCRVSGQHAVLVQQERYKYPSKFVMLQLNPHLEGTFTKLAGRGVMLPKQTAPSQSAAVTGISSFAFQGTNAHALLALPSAPAADPQGSSTLRHAWQKRHTSVLPPLHACLTSAATSGGGEVVTFACMLQSHGNAFLYDHIVRGQSILPAAAYLEMITAATVNATAAAGSAQASCVISGAVFEAPLILPSISQAASIAVFLCKLDLLHGRCKLASTSASDSRGSHHQHMQARVSKLQPDSAGQTQSWGLQKGPQGSALLMALKDSFAKGVDTDKQRHALGTLTVDSALVDGYCIHPSLLDNSLQLAAAAAQPVSSISRGSSSKKQVFIPAGLQALTVPSGGLCIGNVHATAQPDPAAAHEVVCDHSLSGLFGAAVQLTGMQSKAMHPGTHAADQSISQSLYQLTWQASIVGPQTPIDGSHSTGTVSLASGRQDACSGVMHLARAMQQASKAAPYSIGLHLQTGSSRHVVNSLVAEGNHQQASLWGMMRTFQQECPAVSMTGTDTQTVMPHQATGQALLQVQKDHWHSSKKTAPDGYGASARAGAVYRARLLPVWPGSAAADFATAAESEMHLPDLAGGSVVITGGTGMIGSLVSRWILKQGKPHSVTLLSRTGRASLDRTRAVLSSPEAVHGAVISMTMCDVAFTEDSRHCFAGMDQHRQPTSAVIHSGGVLADATVANQKPSGIRAVFAAKVEAAQKWQQALLQQPVQGQVLFSSVAAMLGAPGQLNYAAANAAMDGLASTWRQQGQAGVSSIQWGGWAGGGMAGGDASTATRLARMGMPLITPSQGLNALAAVMQGFATHQPHLTAVLGMVPFKWDTFMENLPPGQTGIFAEFAQPSTGLHSSSQTASKKLQHSAGSKAAALRAEASHGRQTDTVSAAILSQVSAGVTSVLGTTLAVGASLMEQGLDSLASVELRNVLTQQLGVELPATFALDYPNIGDMARHVLWPTCNSPLCLVSLPVHNTTSAYLI